MLKQSADARVAAATSRSGTGTVRIQGVKASKNIKIGLVTSNPPPQPAAGMTRVANAPNPAPAPGTALPVLGRALGATLALGSRIAAGATTYAAVPGQLRGKLTAAVGRLSLLGLAAAGLSVAAAMLLYFQFGAPAALPAASAQTVQTQRAVAEPIVAVASAGAAQAAVATAPRLTADLPAGDEDALVARITAGTLAALRSKQTTTAPVQPTQPAGTAPVAEGSALFQMVRTAAAQGQSAAYIDQLVNGAYQRQEISVPASLIGADGRVDTATLLTLFVGG